MRHDSFSGVSGLIEGDVVVSVSAGAIRDRSREMLSRSDLAVNRLYRVLLGCARRVREGGDPIGVQADLSKVAGVSGTLSAGRRWQSLFEAS